MELQSTEGSRALSGECSISVPEECRSRESACLFSRSAGAVRGGGLSHESAAECRGSESRCALSEELITNGGKGMSQRARKSVAAARGALSEECQISDGALSGVSIRAQGAVLADETLVQQQRWKQRSPMRMQQQQAQGFLVRVKLSATPRRSRALYEEHSSEETKSVPGECSRVQQHR
ncbi:hypothetical protein NDU88_001279 [Pleurodeles waltl]|uniref:Uncharacterized protein n=1 Tax=Pleurodeles waltl TaxID=8319 RepID=A0AAV7LCB0_PLEWA|nr:hypothetical protein NDU88_001279 [Pleurodeles waltl]